MRRKDWVFLILSRLALARFWFNPLVWRLHGELAARSEEAADADALIAALKAIARPGDHVVFMSNGGFDGAPRRFHAALADG